MKKGQFVSIGLSLLLLFSIASTPATAMLTAEPYATKVTPTLMFSETTANCKVSIIGAGSINATLQLYNGGTLVDSWPASGINSLVITGSCRVVSGQSYTLKVVGTIAGATISTMPVTRICP